MKEPKKQDFFFSIAETKKKPGDLILFLETIFVYSFDNKTVSKAGQNKLWNYTYGIHASLTVCDPKYLCAVEDLGH